MVSLPSWSLRIFQTSFGDFFFFFPHPFCLELWIVSVCTFRSLLILRTFSSFISLIIASSPSVPFLLSKSSFTHMLVLPDTSTKNLFFFPSCDYLVLVLLLCLLRYYFQLNFQVSKGLNSDHYSLPIHLLTFLVQTSLQSIIDYSHLFLYFGSRLNLSF